MMAQDNEKLQNLLNGKHEELNGAHGQIRQHQNDIETMRRRIGDYEN